MKAIKLLGVSVVAVALSASAAFAKVGSESAVTPLPKAVTLADNVVVTPSSQAAPAPAPAPTPAQTQVQVQPAQQAVEPVAPAPRTNRTVVTEDRPHNYMGTIAFSALMGGLLGALVGGAVYYLDNQDHAYNIAYWAAGGVLLGTGVGIVNVAADESRSERAVGLNHPKDPVPTYRVSLLNARF
jgi:uncharacterized protein YcfJ